MSVHTNVCNKGIYFITFTCHNWLPLIERTKGYDMVYNFFRVLRRKGHQVTGYVVMPNHLHFLLHYSGEGASLNSLIGNGKRFMAYEIIKRLKGNHEEELLSQLRNSVTTNDALKGQLHNVWKDSFDVKECRTEKFLLQKLQYMHCNPVSGKWKLSKEATDYMHSSALFYLNGKQRYFEIVDYEVLIDWERMYDINDSEPTGPDVKSS